MQDDLFESEKVPKEESLEQLQDSERNREEINNFELQGFGGYEGTQG